MDHRLSISSYQKGTAHVFQLRGRIAIDGTSDFEKTVLAAISAGAQRIVFDMSEVNYISSAGLRVFLIALRHLQNDKNRLWIVGLQPAVRQVFDMARLTELWQMVDRLDDALHTAESSI